LKTWAIGGAHVKKVDDEFDENICNLYKGRGRITVTLILLMEPALAYDGGRTIALGVGLLTYILMCTVASK
jgi:hypothetical protein